ncbi:MAG: hypothetical protein HY228_02950 [Candidatus Yonathbacteria bacterium]|nr:hypothetical protein [Candidatus Yonathbacteria bacterium]
MTTTRKFLDKLNMEYLDLHRTYEDYFWTSYMGDHSVDKKKDEALARRDAFRGSREYLYEAKRLLRSRDTKTRARLRVWIEFFKRYQTPPKALEIKAKIDQLESAILKKKAGRKEGYIDPYSKKFVSASALKMGAMTRTHDDEEIRQACFYAREKLATDSLNEYCEMVALRNQYARMLGYRDFYDFKVQSEDGMTKKELFGLFDTIYKKTKYSFADIRALEKTKPRLRKPWNFAYMMAGDFTKEEDPYFQFEDALLRWGRSFAALSIDFKGGVLTLDLLDRKGKWNNGFCHWPILVHYEKGKRIPGSSNFTCNVVARQVGSGVEGYRTLFHEGGHAAHLLTSEQKDVCLNHEYSPMSTPWAEMQSMFLEEIFASIEWRMRYANDREGKPYPFELFERKARALHPLKPRRLNGIMSVSSFERAVYELKRPTPEKVKAIATRVNKKFSDMSEDSLSLLNTPHIYSWESSGSYHGYGLAELALSQWRAFFYKKYGYIVDNPQVGKEMARVWKLGAQNTFAEFVKLATGKRISPDAFLKEVTMSAEQTIKKAKEKNHRMEKVKPYRKEVDLNATIHLVHGWQEIANNTKSFKDMAMTYKAWILKQTRVK